MSGILNTSQLESHIKSEYEKLREITTKDGVYRPLQVCFNADMPLNKDGYCYLDGYCYSNGNEYHLRYYGDRDGTTSRATADLLQITYLVIKPLISMMAFEYELKNRITDKNAIALQKKIEYFSVIGEDYRKKAEEETEEISKQNSYCDKLKNSR